MKQMTHLDVILWIQENTYEITQDLNEGYTIMYRTEQGGYHSHGITLIECVLNANNAVLQEDNSLDLTSRTPEQQVRALEYVQELKNKGLNYGKLE